METMEDMQHFLPILRSFLLFITKAKVKLDGKKKMLARKKHDSSLANDWRPLSRSSIKVPVQPAKWPMRRIEYKVWRCLLVILVPLNFKGEQTCEVPKWLLAAWKRGPTGASKAIMKNQKESAGTASLGFTRVSVAAMMRSMALTTSLLHLFRFVRGHLERTFCAG